MMRRIPDLFLLALLCALPFAAYALYCERHYGAFFIVGTGPFEQFIRSAETPGSFLGFVAILISGNIHDYNMVLAKVLSTVGNGFFYGGLLWVLLRLTKPRVKAQNDTNAA